MQIFRQKNNENAIYFLRFERFGFTTTGAFENMGLPT